MLLINPFIGRLRRGLREAPGMGQLERSRQVAGGPIFCVRDQAPGTSTVCEPLFLNISSVLASFDYDTGGPAVPIATRDRWSTEEVGARSRISSRV